MLFVYTELKKTCFTAHIVFLLLLIYIYVYDVCEYNHVHATVPMQKSEDRQPLELVLSFRCGFQGSNSGCLLLGCGHNSISWLTILPY